MGCIRSGDCAKLGKNCATRSAKDLWQRQPSGGGVVGNRKREGRGISEITYFFTFDYLSFGTTSSLSYSHLVPFFVSIIHINITTMTNIRKIITHPRWSRMTSKEQTALLCSLTYVQYGVLLQASINYNYISFYNFDEYFVITMGYFEPTLEEDMADRNIQVRISLVQLAMLF